MVGVLDILGGEYKYAILFFLRMDSCLGLHDLKKNMRCEVFTIQSYRYALMSCPEITAFRMLGGDLCI